MTWPVEALINAEAGVSGGVRERGGRWGWGWAGGGMGMGGFRCPVTGRVMMKRARCSPMLFFIIFVSVKPLGALAVGSTTGQPSPSTVYNAEEKVQNAQWGIKTLPT